MFSLGNCYKELRLYWSNMEDTLAYLLSIEIQLRMTFQLRDTVYVFLRILVLKAPTFLVK